MSEENIENITKSDSNFAATFVDHHLLPEVTFNEHCLIKNNISIPKKLIDPYISYILGQQLRNLNTDFTLDNCLFGSAKLTKNADLQSFTKYFRLTLVFMWYSALRERFNFCFSRVLC